MADASRTPRCASVLAERDRVKPAARDIAERLAAALDGPADLVWFCVTPHFASEIEEVADALRDATHPAVLLGCTAENVIGGGHEIEGRPAVTAFGARLPGCDLESFHAVFEQGEEPGFQGYPAPALRERRNAFALLFADPFTFPTDLLLRATNEPAPAPPLVGGMASGGAFPGANRLVVDDRVVDEGAVGVVMSGAIELRTIVSQGCRPVGQHFVVTRIRENVILELGGKKALERLEEVFQELDPDERRLLRRALHLGLAVDEYKRQFERGDYLLRSVIGVDPERGALQINDVPRLGQTVQFHVRDPASAGEDLRLLVERETGAAHSGPPCGALLFSCNGRGSRMFGEPDHDVSRVLRGLGEIPLAGFFAAGEIGPIGRQNFLHGFTASVALLCAAPPVR